MCCNTAGFCVVIRLGFIFIDLHNGWIINCNTAGFCVVIRLGFFVLMCYDGCVNVFQILYCGWVFIFIDLPASHYSRETQTSKNEMSVLNCPTLRNSPYVIIDYKVEYESSELN